MMVLPLLAVLPIGLLRTLFALVSIVTPVCPYICMSTHITCPSSFTTAGVELADQLAHRMGLRSNGVAKSLARRNKYHMGENVRAAGE